MANNDQKSRTANNKPKLSAKEKRERNSRKAAATAVKQREALPVLPEAIRRRVVGMESVLQGASVQYAEAMGNAMPSSRD
jgi:hypothetical protein